MVDILPSDSNKYVCIKLNKFKDTCNSEINTDDIIDNIVSFESDKAQIPDFTLKKRFTE